VNKRDVRPVSHLESEHLNSYLSLFEDYALNFQLQLSLGSKESAADHLALIKEVFQSTDSKLIRLRIVVLEGLLNYYCGHIELAQSQLSWIRQPLSDLGMAPELWQLQRVLGWCWVRLKYSQQQRRELSEETEALLARLAASLPPADRFVYLLNKWTADEEFIAAEIDHIEAVNASIAGASLFSRLWRRLKVMRLLNALLQHADSYKDALSKRTVEGTGAEINPSASLSLWRRLWQHPRDRLTLSFLVLPDRALVVRTAWLSLDYRISPISRIELRQLVGGWHGMMREVKKARHVLLKGRRPVGQDLTLDEMNERASAIASALARALQLPALLKELPKRIGALTIVPDDSLHGFPFAAILHEGKFLVERYALAIAFESFPKKTPATGSPQSEALLIGVSRGAAEEGYRALPGAESELQQVRQWLDGRASSGTSLDIHCLLNDSASKKAVTKHLLRAAFLHVASHGEFHPDKPDSSGIVLIPEPDKVEVLSLRDFSRMELAALQHATIASCSAADHFILPGRWIISLPETLWRSGVGSIFGCMWEVDDDLAGLFAEHFYTHLETLPRDQALRHTQLDCLSVTPTNDQERFLRSPAHWAGFNLYGDYGRLMLCDPKRRKG
jgi:CHAT domain-containing protein